tara:strand:+ start:1206 stop:4586 length:3381 start_codon:yes stop_codon:yes gene_type:complete
MAENNFNIEDLSEEEQQLFYGIAEGAKKVGEKQLTLNPNKTYGMHLNQDEREQFALMLYPELAAEYERLLGPESLAEFTSGLDIDARIKPYNIPPVDYVDTEFENRLENYKRNTKLRTEGEASLSPFEAGAFAMQPGMAGVAGVPSLKKPRKIGYDDAKTIGQLGIDPTIDLDQAMDLGRFRTAIHFGAPRNLTPKDLNYAKDNLGLRYKNQIDPDVKSKWSDRLPGTFKWVVPDRPELGIAYFEEGKPPVMWDSPLYRHKDLWDLTMQEGPALTAEIFIGVKGLNRFDDFLKKVPISPGGGGWTIAQKAMESVAGNILLSGGAAGTNFLQRLTGAAYGAHDRTTLEMLDESGMVFLLAYAGNQTIDVFLNGLPKLVRAYRGQDMGAAEILGIRKAIERIRDSMKGKKVKTVSGRDEKVSLLDIDEAIEEVSEQIRVKLPKYNPSIAQGSKDSTMADIERLLIETGSNVKYSKFFQELMDGNDEVIQKFFRALYSGLDVDVTGQTVGRELTNLFNRQESNFIAEGESIIAGIRGNLDDFKSAGNKNLLDDVLDEKVTTKLVERFTTRVNEISSSYKSTLRANVEERLLTDELSIPFSSRGVRNSVEKFKNAGMGDKGRFMNVGGKEASLEFKKLFNEESVERLTRYSKGDVTLAEANILRMDLNTYLSRIDPSKDAASARIFNLGRTVFRDLEDNMIQQVRKRLPPDQADEIIELFAAQKYGTELANQQIIKDIGKQSPEGLVGYLFTTNTKKAAKNTKAAQFMEFLESSGSQTEINTLRREVIDYVKNNYLDVADDSPLKLAAAYKKFLRNNRGTLNEIFPEEQFGKMINSPKEFNNNIIKPLENLEKSIALFERTFGERDPFNIVTKILAKGEGDTAGGKLIEDLDMLDRILKTATGKERKILEDQLSDATKKYLITATTTDDLFDLNKLNQLMDSGFGPADMVGGPLSFEGLYGRLIKDPDNFFKNLNVLRDMATRQTVDLTTLSSSRSETKRQLMDPAINYLKRFFIKPLTQFGRRTSAMEKLVGERNLAFVGEVMRSPELFDAYVATITGRKKLNNFIRVLNTHDTLVSNDIANTLKDYNSDRKKYEKSPRDRYRDIRARDVVPGIEGTVFDVSSPPTGAP